jgi:hypothetical protein
MKRGSVEEPNGLTLWKEKTTTSNKPCETVSDVGIIHEQFWIHMR